MTEEIIPSEDPMQPIAFTVTEADMTSSRVGQCKMINHQWRKLNDNEIACEICPTVLTIYPEDMGKYIK